MPSGLLVERGQLRFHDAIADYIPEFAKHGKGQVTLAQVLSHQGGFPNANVTPAAWEDHNQLRQEVCDFTLEWEPGAKVMYHSAAAHWVQAVLIEAVTGQDYRQYIRDNVTQPLGLDGLWVGVPDTLRAPGRRLRAHWRVVSMWPSPSAIPRLSGVPVPGGGGYATAADLTTFYQMLLNLGALNGTRLLSPRTVQYVTRNHTGERIDERFGMPMHRGLGVHVRGTTLMIRGLGSTASPSTLATVARGPHTPGLTPRRASLLPICPIRRWPNPTTAAVWTRS